MRRLRYQSGMIELVKCKKQDVWTFRFYEQGTDGKRPYRRVRVGTKEQYPTETAVKRAVDGLRLSINSGKALAEKPTFGAVTERYLREELPERRFSTRVSYKSLLAKWIQAKRGEVRLCEIHALEIEHWLKSLNLARKTKSNIRNLMHVIFECARRWELVSQNPIELVRQSGRRQHTPRRLTIEELRRLLAHLEQPYSIMVILAACLGLRVGEILGLQWGDVHLLNATITIRRSVYQYHVGPAKTANSEAALPLAPEVVSALGTWLTRANYRADTDFIFASTTGRPRDADKLREKVLQAAADRAGLGKIGWHSLRHSFATVLDAAGARMKVAQELMRHSSITTTMDVYTGAVERDKREAAARVASAVLGRIQ